MRAFVEEALCFSCLGDTLVGVLTRPVKCAAPPDGMTVRVVGAAPVGVVIVVGGPQYRVGSHRQFVLLARQLASQGVACLRFDVRGMGDADGAPRAFDALDEDIRAAVDAMLVNVAELESVVLWGLCDGATAACLYAIQDRRIAGLALLNPWLQTERGQAEVLLQHYYLARLRDPALWRRLLGGRLNPLAALRGLIGTAKRAVRANDGSDPARSNGAGAPSGEDLPVRVASALAQAQIPLLVMLSGRDFVAREFEAHVSKLPQWEEVMSRAWLEHLSEADHTLSKRDHANHAGELTLSFVNSLVARLTS